MDGDQAVRSPHRLSVSALAAALLAAGLLAGGAAAQSGVLVGNTGQTDAHGLIVADEASGNAAAQAFRTGTDESGYLLESVVLDFVTLEPDPEDPFATISTDYAVTVREDVSGSPSPAVLYRLTNPATTEGGPNEFAAPANARLRAETTYHVVAVGPANGEGPRWWGTPTGSGLDSGSAAGWSIDAGHRRGGEAVGWSVGAHSLQMQVKGSALGAPDAPTGLTAEAVSPTQVDLSWEEPATGGFVAGYEVEFARAAGGPWTPAGAPGGTTFSHLWCAVATTCHYRVRAVNDSGGSDWAAASATTIAPDWDQEIIWSTTMSVGVYGRDDGMGDGFRFQGYDPDGTPGDSIPAYGSISGSAEFTYEGTNYTITDVSEGDIYIMLQILITLLSMLR